MAHATGGDSAQKLTHCAKLRSTVRALKRKPHTQPMPPFSQRKLRQRTRSGTLTLSSPISKALNDKLTRQPVRVGVHHRSLPNSKPMTVSRDARANARSNARNRAPKPDGVRGVIDLANGPIMAPVVANLADQVEEADGEETFDGALRMTPRQPLFTPTSAGSERSDARDQNLGSYSSDYGVDLFPRRIRY